MADDALVIFTPSGKRGRFALGTPVLTAARQLGVDLDSVCGGRGICSKCQITPGYGEFSKHGVTVSADALSDWNSVEERYKSIRGLTEGRRLGCQAKVMGDVVIDVPPESQVHKQVIRKSAAMRDIVMDPATRAVYVEVAEPDMHEPTGDFERLSLALRDQWQVADVEADLALLRRLQPTLRKGDWKVTVAVHQGHHDAHPRILDIWPGFHEGGLYGLAIDLGSTTIAAHLCDLRDGTVLASSGVMNPQIRFGEDLMSRVSYVMMNKGGEKELTTVIRNAINELVHELADKASITPDKILEVVMVGNPIMHHILLGIDPTPLGAAPFVLATSEATFGAAEELDIHLPNASFYVGPCIAGHVGADTAAAILSEGPHRGSSMQLLIDVGTNAEIVLGDTTRQFAASSPTGPAFEGAQLSCGQRATAGAIEKVRIDPVTLEPRFRAIGIDMWSDEAGFSEAVQDTPVTGVCGSGIIEVIAEMYLAGIISQDGVIQGSLVEKTPRVVADERTFSYLLYENSETKLFITQNDIRAIQLAKAALRAGIDLLVEHAGSPEVHDIRLAGAFGAHIDPTYAMVLGLVPDCPLPGVRSVGNSAGTGAAKALLSRAQRREMEHTVTHVTKIETATEPRFQDLFVAAMAFPHAYAPTPNLSTLVTLPPRIENSGDGAGGGQRRRRRA